MVFWLKDIEAKKQNVFFSRSRDPEGLRSCKNDVKGRERRMEINLGKVLVPTVKASKRTFLDFYNLSQNVILDNSADAIYR